MKNMTLRGLDPQLADRLQQAAKEEGKSVNQFVLDTLKKRLGLEKDQRFTAVHHDMDHLFGKWSEQEFGEIQNKIDAERTIDEKLWR
jgi:plasmid stability protein